MAKNTEVSYFQQPLCAIVTAKARANINYSHKHFSEYMENKSFKSFFLYTTNKNEFSVIISSFESKQVSWSK